MGLSQWGAEAMAEKNGDGKEYYKRILLHYFTAVSYTHLDVYKRQSVYTMDILSGFLIIPTDYIAPCAF